MPWPPPLHQGFASTPKPGWGQVVWAAVLGTPRGPGSQLVSLACAELTCELRVEVGPLQAERPIKEGADDGTGW